MTTPSTKMGLALPSQADQFSTSDIRSNWEKIDAAPGTHICLSNQRPTWSTSQAGRRIFETDTNLEWTWTGTAFKRIAGLGLLHAADGTPSYAERVTDFSTNSDSTVKVVAVTNVVVPAGQRPIRVDVSWKKAFNDKGSFTGTIYQSNTNNGGPVLASWLIESPALENNAGGGSFFAIEPGGLAAGNYDFSFQVNAPASKGGSTRLEANTVSPVIIYVTEL